VGVGGAVVALSDPAEEFAETLLKGDVLLRAVHLHACGPGGAPVEIAGAGCAPDQAPSPALTPRTPQSMHSIAPSA
jgi:hypothetical protein